jgi:RNA polymerase sigma factor (sigma-70 family)
LKRAVRPIEPDAVLLRRYLETRDEAAFTELVRRYGRLVWGLCRNLLPTETDADDAFQATFLTLVKSAAKIRTDRLGPWLYGVAYRVCQNAKRLAARRKKREQKSATAEAARPVADSTWDAALAAVHDELHKLSEPQRVAFVLCCLEGKSTTEAAEQLGLTVGTFSSRLTRAKQTLMDRLAARGLTASVVTLGVITGGAAHAPAQVIDRAVQLATAIGVIPSNILSLTHGVLTMTGSAKLLAATVLVAGGLVAGFGGVFVVNAQEPGKKEVTSSNGDNKAAQLDIQLRHLWDPRQQLTPDNALLKENDEKIKRLKLQQTEAITGDAAELDLLYDMLLPLSREKFVMLLPLSREKFVQAKAAPEKKPQSEFKYFGQAANFAPTPDELEALVKRGEEGGYKFVGITNMKGMSQQGDAVPTLVFRRDAAAKTAKYELYEQALKGQTDALKRKLAEDSTREKLKGTPENLPKAVDQAFESQVAAERAKLEAEITVLRARIDELSGKNAKKLTMSAKFNPADLGLGKGDVVSLAMNIYKLVQLKFGDKATVTLTLDPRDQMLVVDGDAEAVKWLQDTIKKLKPAPKEGGLGK